MEKENTNSRRLFLNKGLKIGLFSAIGLAALSKLFKTNNTFDEANEEMIEVMSTDVDIIQLPALHVEDITH